MMSYINETDFVIENKKLVYPEIVTDGLQLYYDAKGKRDTDYHRDTMLDMSGNKNHGKLHNFAYEKHSGYKDGLVFDYIDDKLVRPALNLQPDDFTFMLNGNIISFSPDGTIKRVQDGEVIEAKGTNLVRNGDFSDGITGWSSEPGGIASVSNGKAVVAIDTLKLSIGISSQRMSAIVGDKYYLSAIVNAKYSNATRVRYGATNTTSVYPSPNQDTLVSGTIKANTNSNWVAIHHDVNTNYEVNDTFTIDNVQVFNLTATFGVGNEPTKEQMDEIVNRFGFIPNAQDLIDSTEYKGNVLGDMENIIDGLYKTEILSGNPIFTDKADDNSAVHVEVDGKSVGGGSGKNVYPYVEPMNFSWANQPFDTSYFKEGVTYSYSYEIEVITGKVSGVVSDFDVRTGRIVYGGVQGIDMREWYVNSKIGDSFIQKGTFVGGSSSTPFYVCGARNNTTATAQSMKVTKIMINEGSSLLPYEPPSPTPDYPIEINSLNDFGVVSQKSEGGMIDGIEVGGRNLAYSENIGYKYGTLLSNSTKNIIGNGRWFIDIQPGFLPETTYTISNKKIINEGSRGSNLNVLIYNNEINTLVQTIGSFSSGNKTTFTTSSNVKDTDRMLIYVSNGNVSGNFEIQEFKLEKGSKATDWTPAPEDNAYDTLENNLYKTNILLSEPLRSVGDAKDRLFRDNDGLWKVERNVGEVTLKGTESWKLFQKNTNTTVFTTYNATNPWMSNAVDFTSNVADKNVTSSHFPIKNTALDENLLTMHSVGTNKWLWIALEDNIAKTLSEYTTWLGSNNVQVIYRTNPTIETLSQTDQDKLNNIASYKGSNYLYTIVDKTNILPSYVRDNLKPNLNAKFLYNNWYKEDRVINNLMIYNRALTNEEMLQNYKTIKRRWGM